MRRSRAFVLPEILMGMALQAGFILVLCTSFYLMLSFYTRTQQVLLARQKGEKVIAYIGARVRNVGLGLQNCKSSRAIRNSFYTLLKDTLQGEGFYLLPIEITSGDFEHTQTVGEIFRGNKLTLLYTQRALSEFNLTITTDEIDSPDVVKGTNKILELTNENVPPLFRIAGYVYGTRIKEIFQISKSSSASDFNLSDGHSAQFLDRYAVLSGTGIPILLTNNEKNIDNKHFELKAYNCPAKVYPGDELLYLKCERMFVEGNNFKHQKYLNGFEAKIPNEDSILDIYMELNKETHIFDLYVLASGGTNSSGNTVRPEIWPQDFWKPEYEQHTVYVSRASWKLHNIPDGFVWDD